MPHGAAYIIDTVMSVKNNVSYDYVIPLYFHLYVFFWK